MLKKLFRATFANGEIYDQNPENKSILLERKSCFTDILHLSQNNPITLFELHCEGFTAQINLINGEIKIHSPSSLVIIPERPGLVDFRPVYFICRSVNTCGGNIKSVGVDGFNIGWQANDEKGNNVQNIIFVN